MTVRGLSESALIAIVGPLAIWAVGLLADQNARIGRMRSFAGEHIDIAPTPLSTGNATRGPGGA